MIIKLWESRGSLWSSQPAAGADGTVSIFENATMRGRVWRFSQVCFHRSGLCFAAADERGQVFAFFVKKNEYRVVRAATGPVLAMEFLHARRNELLVSFARGDVLCINTETERTVANLQLEDARGVVHKLVCHPTKPIAFCCSTREITMWDCERWRRTRVLSSASQGALDLGLDWKGEECVVVMPGASMFRYATTSGEYRGEFAFPAAERRPEHLLIAHCSDGHFFAACGENGMLYIWERNTMCLVCELPIAVRFATQIAFVPKTHVLLILGNDGAIRGIAVTNTTCTLLFVFTPQACGATGHPTVAGETIAALRAAPASKAVGAAAAAGAAAEASSGSLSAPPPHDSRQPSGVRASDMPSSQRHHHHRSGSQHGSYEPHEAHRLMTKRVTPRSSAPSAGTSSGSGGDLPSQGGDPDAAEETTSSQGAENAVAVLSFALERHGKYLTAVCSDGTLRVLDLPVALRRGADRLSAHAEQTLTVNLLMLRSRPPHATEGYEDPHKADALSETDREHGQYGKSQQQLEQPQQQHLQGHALEQHRVLRSPQDPGRRLGAAQHALAGAAAAHSTDDEDLFTDFGETLASRSDRSETAGSTAASGATGGGKSSGTDKSRRGKHTHARAFAQAPHRRVPLHRFCGLAPQNTRLTSKRLRHYLRKYREFPTRYRPLIWRFLLKLPENEESFDALLEKGVHPAFEDLDMRYPIKNRRLFLKLRTVCSALAFWAPVFGEVCYLPVLAFPFVVVFASDILSAFECCVAFLVHWAGSWQATFPQPPVHILDTCDRILEHHDPELHRHLVSKRIGPHVWAWPMLSSVFSEILTRDDWLRFMDNIFAHADDVHQLLVAPVAYAVTQRTALMSAASTADAQHYLRSQNPLHLRSFLTNLAHLRVRTPAALLPPLQRGTAAGASAAAAATSSGVPQLASRSPSAANTFAQAQDTTTQLRATLLGDGATGWPLPEGHYPTFNQYPKFVMDTQLKERERLAAEEGQLRRRESMLAEVSSKLDDMERDHNAAVTRYRRMIEAEQARQSISHEQEQQYFEALKLVDDRMAEQKMRQLSKAEQFAQEEMELLSRLRALENRRVDQEEKRRKGQLEYTVQSRMQEEAVLAMETKLSQRIAELRWLRFEDEHMRKLKAELDNKKEQLSLEEQVTQQRWRTEDEERKARIDAQRSADEEGLRLMEMERMQTGVQQSVVRAALEREKRLSEVVHERTLRQTEEDEWLQRQQRQRIAMREQEVERKRLELEAEQLTAKHVEARERRMREQLETIGEYKQRMMVREEARRRRLEELERQNRTEELKKELVKRQENDMEQLLQDERRIQDAVLQLEREQMDLDIHESRVVMHEDAAHENLQYQQRLHQLEEDLLRRQRERFAELLAEIRNASENQKAQVLARVTQELRQMQRERMQTTADPQHVHMQRPPSVRPLTTAPNRGRERAAVVGHASSVPAQRLSPHSRRGARPDTLNQNDAEADMSLARHAAAQLHAAGHSGSPPPRSGTKGSPQSPLDTNTVSMASSEAPHMSSTRAAVAAAVPVDGNEWQWQPQLPTATRTRGESAVAASSSSSAPVSASADERRSRLVESAARGNMQAPSSASRGRAPVASASDLGAAVLQEMLVSSDSLPDTVSESSLDTADDTDRDGAATDGFREKSRSSDGAADDGPPIRSSRGVIAAAAAAAEAAARELVSESDDENLDAIYASRFASGTSAVWQGDVATGHSSSHTESGTD